MIAAIVVLFVVLGTPLGVAWRAWRLDRPRLVRLRQRLTLAGLLLSSVSCIVTVVFMARIALLNERVSFPGNPHDWAWSVARIGAMLATIAVAGSLNGIGQTRIFAVLGNLLQWWLIALTYASV